MGTSIELLAIYLNKIDLGFWFCLSKFGITLCWIGFWYVALTSLPVLLGIAIIIQKVVFFEVSHFVASYSRVNYIHFLVVFKRNYTNSGWS